MSLSSYLISHMEPLTMGLILDRIQFRQIWIPEDLIESDWSSMKNPRLKYGTHVVKNKNKLKWKMKQNFM